MAKRFHHLFNLSLLFLVIACIVMSFNVSAYKFSNELLALVYVPLAFLGQSFAMSLILFFIFLPLLILPPRVLNILFTLVAGISLYLLAIDSWVFSIYRFHINAFFILMFFTDMEGMGIGFTTVMFAVISLVVWLLLIYQVAIRVQTIGRLRKSVAIYIMLFFLTFIGQSIHAWGYAHNMKRIVSLTHTIPLYYPLIATRDLKKWGWFREDLVEDNLSIELEDVSGFSYPAAPLNCPDTGQFNIVVVTLESWRFDRMTREVTPNIFEMGQQSLVFDNHLSSGSVTDRGLFGLMYGVTSSYITSALGAGSEPALISAIRAMEYDTWVLANQNIEANKLDQLFFSKTGTLQSRGIGAVYDGDRGVIESFNEKLQASNSEDRFFSYLLFNSSHFPYWTPPEYSKPFEPSERFSPSKATDDTDREPYFNQYSNSLHYLDGLMGELITSLKEHGVWDDTILVITGDHGEEFKDQDVAYWGHGSNFSRYQIGVPLVIHWPGKEPKNITYRTSHEDVFATLLLDGLNCDVDISTVSTGYSLFDSSPRVNIVESYVNQAIVFENTVTELYPGFVKSYDIDDITEEKKASAHSIQGVKKVLSQFK